ncbi:hypothetical protein PPERSA_04301 [Pseudocohnilembus persalinus]|uniref:NAD(P)-binding domain n=1 Tax=Pseudocohnilembus persalinus TaxID=266149 RepID=A0A0V0QNW8_PSEPJ|nr:hypothetical protein PPERSA_04301 [Pseudocohnilembus persalinus]|eukprot:KRX03793.1 hypothetical protein PPERSA_04301 [Pseudocohnilembus persalinus]
MSTCLITGGASGIGLQCGIEFLEVNENNKLSIVDYFIPFQVENDLIKKFGQKKIIFIRADVTDHQQIYNAFKETVFQFGRLDYVLNNAGVGLKEQVITSDEQDLIKSFERLQKVININLTAVIRVTMIAIQFMNQLKSKGHIINVSSMGGLLPQGDAAVYSATKHGVIGFSRSLVYLQKEYGIRVNTLCPSFVETPMIVKNLMEVTGKKINPGELVQLGIAMHPHAIAKAFIELYHDKDINGEVLTIGRGGALVRIPTEEEMHQFKEKIKIITKQQLTPKPKL